MRLERHAWTKWGGACREVIVRFKGAYAYVDAFPAKRQILRGTPPERRAIIEATPTHLCRLGYMGNPDRWEYAFFKYSNEKYALSITGSGSFEATPEEAFDTSARVYLAEG